jgi:hopanoid biosynthesis associated protein HpnK
MQAVFTADDFGDSHAINTAVIRAHQKGTLTAASLMTGGQAFQQAAALARENRSLALGLHLVVLAGKAVLPPQAIPHLVDNRGFFRSDPLQAGIYYFFSTTARKELAREISAQFERFAQIGLPLSHVDGHEHMHLHPTVLPLILPLAQELQACGIRIPREDFRLAIHYDSSRFWQKTTWTFIFRILTAWCISQLRDGSLLWTDKVFGMMQSGCMDEDYVIQVLRHLDVATAELYFHPSTSSERVPLGPNATDLATLLSPEIHAVLEERCIQPTTYPRIRSRQGILCSSR